LLTWKSSNDVQHQNASSPTVTLSGNTIDESDL
jgi:hypothetical protein